MNTEVTGGLDEPTQQQRFFEGTRIRLEESALKYARMKQFGMYLDDSGNVCRVCFTDQQDQAKYLLESLGRDAVRLLEEISMMPLPPRRT